VRLPQFLNLTSSKTQQCCETSLFFELDTIQNEAILWDFLNFWTWQHQKTKQFCETSWDIRQKWKVECRADGLVPMGFSIFPLLLSKVLRLPRKREARSYKVLQLSRKSIFPQLKIWCSKKQPLSGNQRPDLLTSLNKEYVSCTAPATENASCQILFKCPTHDRFWKCDKTLTFCSLLTRCPIPCLPRDTSSSH